VLFLVGEIMIDSRIKAVMNFVEKNSRVADIGTDHGYLAIELVKNSVASFVVAGDKNAQPLDAAKKNIAAAGLSDFIDTRLGDGLKILREGEVDTICIAGMGGALITEILNDSPQILKSAKQLILQPMNAMDKLQAWLKNNSWYIADIELAEVGGIIYEIISAVKNPALVATVTKKENSPLLKKFYQQKILKLQRVLDEMSKSPAAVASEKFQQIQSEIESLKQK
jgi:tRNA (adenine22-N1)-methyltransferase